MLVVQVWVLLSSSRIHVKERVLLSTWGQDQPESLASLIKSVTSGSQWDFCLKRQGREWLRETYDVSFCLSLTCSHMWMCICTHMCTHMPTYVCAHTCLHMDVHTYAYTWICTHMPTHGCAHIPTCRHVHTPHTWTYILIHRKRGCLSSHAALCSLHSQDLGVCVCGYSLLPILVSSLCLQCSHVGRWGIEWMLGKVWVSF